jgi:hypothetical protein
MPAQFSQNALICMTLQPRQVLADRQSRLIIGEKSTTLGLAQNASALQELRIPYSSAASVIPSMGP